MLERVERGIESRIVDANREQPPIRLVVDLEELAALALDRERLGEQVLIKRRGEAGCQPLGLALGRFESQGQAAVALALLVQSGQIEAALGDRLVGERELHSLERSDQPTPASFR